MAAFFCFSFFFTNFGHNLCSTARKESSKFAYRGFIETMCCQPIPFSTNGNDILGELAFEKGVIEVGIDYDPKSEYGMNCIHIHENEEEKEAEAPSTYGTKCIRINEIEEEKEAEEESEYAKETRVSFGGVNVYVHNLTLGDHPGGKTPGPPLTLEWEMDDSFHFKSVDSFEHSLDRPNQRQWSEYGSVKVLDSGLRQLIAAANHSSSEIRKTLSEVYTVRQERTKSKEEDLEKAEAKEAKKEARRLARINRKSKNGINGLLARRRFFGI